MDKARPLPVVNKPPTLKFLQLKPTLALALRTRKARRGPSIEVGSTPSLSSWTAFRMRETNQNPPANVPRISPPHFNPGIGFRSGSDTFCLLSILILLDPSPADYNPLMISPNTSPPNPEAPLLSPLLSVRAATAIRSAKRDRGRLCK